MTIALIAVNVAMFLLSGYGVQANPYVPGFAIVPIELLREGFLGSAGSVPVDAFRVPERVTLVSYMFLHADIFHLVGNMLFLWVFGDNVEDSMGHLRFLVFYFACGIFAGLVHAWLLPDSSVPLIGASGAVAGVIAAYLMLHPRVSVWVLVMRFIPVRLSAAIVLGLWVAMQVVMVLLPQVGPVAWWAHIGGLIAGAVLIIFMRLPGVPLFDRPQRPA
ncbi:MAG: rhomboid family intramembrane serine protease [Hyphomicrobiaceae bacterium]